MAIIHQCFSDECIHIEFGDIENAYDECPYCKKEEDGDSNKA